MEGQTCSGKERCGKEAEQLNDAGRRYQDNDTAAPFFVYFGSTWPEVIAAFYAKYITNPNPSPTGKMRFGLYWSGAVDGT